MLRVRKEADSDFHVEREDDALVADHVEQLAVSLTGVGGALREVHTTCVRATSPAPPGRTAVIGLMRVGAMMRSPPIVGDATIRYKGQ